MICDQEITEPRNCMVLLANRHQKTTSAEKTILVIALTLTVLLVILLLGTQLMAPNVFSTLR